MVPGVSHNLAFIGQFAEVPEDVVFTVEYSVRTAQTAVYTLLNLDKKPLRMYHGGRHLDVLIDAMKTILT